MKSLWHSLQGSVSQRKRFIQTNLIIIIIIIIIKKKKTGCQRKRQQ